MTMKKPDDSSLALADLLKVEAQARQSLDKAAAWGRFPTPVDDILAAAKLRVAPKSAFDPYPSGHPILTVAGGHG